MSEGKVKQHFDPRTVDSKRHLRIRIFKRRDLACFFHLSFSRTLKIKAASPTHLTSHEIYTSGAVDAYMIFAKAKIWP